MLMPLLKLRQAMGKWRSAAPGSIDNCGADAADAPAAGEQAQSITDIERYRWAERAVA
jgi:hypothetical protein